jgi:hypothetical protein
VPATRYHLAALVTTASPSAIRPILERLVAPHRGVLRPTEGGFEVETIVEGEDARSINRQLLSEMRRVERHTQIRSEFVTDRGAHERFFDYVPKGSGRPAPPP